MWKLPTGVLSAAAVALFAAAVWSQDVAGPTGSKRSARPEKPPAARGAPTTRPSPAPGPRRRRRFKPLTEEQEKEVLDYLKGKRPDYYKRVLEYRQSDTRRYHRAIGSMWQFISWTKRMPKKLREAYETLQKTDIDMWRLAREIQGTKDATAKQNLQRRLRKLGTQRFDARHTILEYRLKHMEDQIEQLKGELKDRLTRRKALIEESIERFLEGAAHRARSTTRPASPPSRGRKPPFEGEPPRGPRD